MRVVDPPRLTPRVVETPRLAPLGGVVPGASAGVQFAYGRHGNPRQAGQPLEGPYAIIDFETTGVSPRTGDRIIEVAIVRVSRDGRVLDEYSTLLNPEGRDTGPVHVHRIRNGDVCGAPMFRDAAADILSRLDGAVVVAHNASFEQRFLDSELARINVGIGHVPALCTLWLARQTLSLPNYKLETIARSARLSLADGHTALGDVRTVAALLPGMLEALRSPIFYGTPPTAHGHVARGVALPRAGLRAGVPVGQIAAVAVGALRPAPPAAALRNEDRGAPPPSPKGTSSGSRRCSACGEPGHYRPSCRAARTRA